MSTSELKENPTLEEAKAWLRERFGEGADCPLCHQHVKLYKRPLTSSMAYVLLLLYRDATVGTQWVHMPTFIVSQTKDGDPKIAAAVRGDWAKLRFWWLLEEPPEDYQRPDGSSRVGLYRITDLGRQFCEGTLAVPAHIYLYNEKIVNRPVAERVTIYDALGTKFSYQEIMQPCH